MDLSQFVRYGNQFGSMVRDLKETQLKERKEEVLERVIRWTSQNEPTV